MAYAHLLSRHLLSSSRNLADSRDNLQTTALLCHARWTLPSYSSWPGGCCGWSEVGCMQIKPTTIFKQQLSGCLCIKFMGDYDLLIPWRNVRRKTILQYNATCRLFFFKFYRCHTFVTSKLTFLLKLCTLALAFKCIKMVQLLTFLLQTRNLEGTFDLSIFSCLSLILSPSWFSWFFFLIRIQFYHSLHFYKTHSRYHFWTTMWECSPNYLLLFFPLYSDHFITWKLNSNENMTKDSAHNFSA